MEFSILVVFILVYIGMALGNWPGLALDRTGIALLGAIAMIELQKTSLQDAVEDIDVASIAILFSFMILSAQFYFSGFYTYVAYRMEKWRISPQYFLLIVISISGILSAVLINDIVCMAMTPLLIKICFQKKLNPVPFLIGLACGSNIGSASTLIGNPQNMLIGQILHIPFASYTLHALIPCLLGLGVAWWVIKQQTGDQWQGESQNIQIESPAFDAWQSGKGLFVLILLFGIFLFFEVPREHISLIAAGFLLVSRKTASRKMLSFIDWQLLVLFIGLFIVNREFNRSEIVQTFFQDLQRHSVKLNSPVSIFLISVLLSNLISNAPAVMLLLPFVANPFTGSLLALSSTLAGNMFIVGSIANIIVVTLAANFGIRISWRQHMAVGLPVSILTLGLAALSLYLQLTV